MYRKVCLGICSICGVFVQYVGYLLNMWLICSISGSFVQYVACLINMWLIYSINSLLNRYVDSKMKLGCMTFIIIKIWAFLVIAAGNKIYLARLQQAKSVSRFSLWEGSDRGGMFVGTVSGWSSPKL